MEDSYQKVFAALADPTRRLLIERLSRHGGVTPRELTEGFPMTRQGVSKHLKILEDAGLVTARKEGRERQYTLAPQQLYGAVHWVTLVTDQWRKRLSALEDYLAAEPHE